jgi:FkbM family methyltransferase
VVRWLSLLLICPVGCGGEAERRDIVGSEAPLYSQGKEETIIRDFFQDRREGFFLDVGSAHFQRHSTTYYLERHLDWSGIAVDALPDWAPGYARHRPRTRFFQYIVTDHAGTVDVFYRVPGTLELSSTIEDRVVDGRVAEAQELRIPTITLDALLEREGVERIDLLSVDIERGAPKALAAFDIQRFRPALVCIEAGAGADYRKALRRWFEEQGYERIAAYGPHDWVNWYFRPVGSRLGPPGA